VGISSVQTGKAHIIVGQRLSSYALGSPVDFLMEENVLGSVRMAALAASLVQSRMSRLSNRDRNDTMKYMMMFYENEANVAAQRDQPERTGPYWDAWNAYMGALYPSGIVVGGDALMPPSAATSVRLDGSKRLVQDGPVAATKEQLAGYVVIEVPDLDTALYWAARCPAATYGAVEVRPVLDLSNQG
jgi:hypothetical protein